MNRQFCDVKRLNSNCNARKTFYALMVKIATMKHKASDIVILNS